MKTNIKWLAVVIPATLLWCGQTLSAELQDVRDMALELAEQRYTNKQHHAYFVSAYLDGLKSQLVYPQSSISRTSTLVASSDGFSAGRDAAVTNTALSGITLEDFGYVLTNVTGSVFLAFEQQEFYPFGVTQVWWIVPSSNMHQMYSSFPPTPNSLDRTAIIGSFVGYLSPIQDHKYGHFGHYKREIVVQKIIEMTTRDKTGNVLFPELYQAYTNLLAAMDTGRQEEIEKLCIPGTIQFTIDPRDTKSGNTRPPL